ncbi:MAG: DUF547 domain-containing protein [Herpetosiphonaceae bacterium]|nr:DUF547 domain-containing protein [Herpetosiphonaceae bacterium]
MSKQPWTAQLVNATALGSALLFDRAPQIGTQPTGELHFKQHDWNALLGRFVQGGEVDYAQFKRVRRILEAYLERVADARPDEWTDPNEQLAFYLNTYNAIVIHQLLVHGPVASFLEVPIGFARPYPVGRENISLHELLHSKVRAFRDPRVHMALVRAGRSCPLLQSYAYTGPQLQQQLAEVTHAFLRDEQRGLRYDPATNTLYLSSILRRFAGDWAEPDAMPNTFNLLRGQMEPHLALPNLRRWMPEHVAVLLDRPASTRPRIAFMAYDWRLNGTFETPTVHSRAV